MRKKIIQWFGREFLVLSCEGKTQATATEETAEIFRRFDEELRKVGLSLNHTVRTRLWARDRESRDLGSRERVRVLSGKARSASSSYIEPDHFDSNARVALDLFAMRPSRPGLEKAVKEYDPPRNPIRYLILDSLVFLSGMSGAPPTLADQLGEIIPRITASLTEAGSSWEKVVKASFFLHRSQKLENLKEHFRKMTKAEIPQMEYAFVDGYSTEGKLIEIEITAEIFAESVCDT